MQVRALSKIGAVSISILLTMVMLNGSVAEKIAVTSEKDHTFIVGETQKPAPTTKPISSVRSSVKKKRMSKPYLTAAVIAPAVPKLLPAVQKTDITEHHQQLAHSILKALPPDCRTYLKNFYVQYKDVKQRGLGGKTTIIIDGTAPDPEFAGLLIHECGHVTHSNMLGSAISGKSAFRDGNDAFYSDSPMVTFFAISWMNEAIRRKDARDADFASGYGKSDAFEDFAETFTMYILHRDAFQERAKTNPAMAAKLAWMETNLPVTENMLGISSYSWDKKVPWDVTRLAFNLDSSF